MNRIKAIIFDYDGVIAESVDVKTEAFAELYSSYGEDVVKKVVSHHKANGGISRFEKFKLYHKEFLSKNLNENEIERLAKQFSDLVLQKVVDSLYVPGAFAFISDSYQKYDFFISTGTPREEIEIILEMKNLRKYFREVYGSPEKKAIHVKKILEKHNYEKDEVVFIGDALTDRNAARTNGIFFIGRFTTTEEIKKEKYIFNDFYELKEIINKL